jgi:hypothetical protein
MIKSVIRYDFAGESRIVYGERSRVKTFHRGYVITSPVTRISTQSGVFETVNSVYVPRAKA